MYVPLKITSEYSLLKSLIKIADLVTFLKEHHINTASLVDDNLGGIIPFYKAMKSHNLKPILGLNIKLNNYDLYLYPLNYAGYQNLLKIHTLKEFNNLTDTSIKPYLENIKIILPYLSYSLIATYNQAYLGYSTPQEKEEALKLTPNIVYYNNILVFNKEDTQYLKYLEAISKGVLLKDITTDYSYNYFKLDISEEDSLTTLKFCQDIDIELPFNKRYIPIYNKQVNSYEYLTTLAHKGLNKRLKGIINPQYLNRLEYELKVIQDMGFVDYFLIVYDYVLYAKKNNILVGPGRGSAAGSLVSYSLGITDVDPLKYNLLFERFLNPERISMPDIDIDFEYTKRSLVIDYVKERYGSSKVALIVTYGTLASKQVLRDVAKVLDINLKLVNEFMNLINAKASLKENYQGSVINFLNINPELKKVYQIALKLEGLKRHISTHAAGVVISSIDLDTIIPTFNNDNNLMTGVTMEYLEELGLLKMDFLALRNLTIIAQVLDLIQKDKGLKLNLNLIDLKDPQVFKLFSKADTEGIFQFESSGMKNLMLKLKPTTFADLVASIALFRPGPMQNIDSFIKRKYNQEKVSYLHPDLEPILKETYGIIVYQEQVMQILVKIGGYSYAEADNIRRAMSKKKEAIIKADKQHFIDNATKRGYSLEVSQAIYALILKFANYGFNKAHSVSYALIGYQMAYLKVKFPLYFITNLLNMSIGSESKTKEYILEAKAKGLKIFKPDINISSNTYEIKDNSLILPLLAIKSLGDNSTLAIITERAQNGLYLDYLDFIARNFSNINKKVFIALIEAGALDSFNLTKKTMLENLDIALNYGNLIKELDISLVEKPLLTIYEEYSLEELRTKEFNSFGFYLTNHPVSKYNDASIIKIANISSYFNKHIKCVVLIEKIKSIKTKKGDNMAFVTASDETATTDFVIFPSYYAILNTLAISDIIYVLGKVTKRFDTYQINVEKIEKVEGDINA